MGGRVARISEAKPPQESRQIMTPVTPITPHREPETSHRSWNCQGTLMVCTLFKRWLVVIGRLETPHNAEIREARERNMLKVTL
jgi:hypothetical protein